MDHLEYIFGQRMTWLNLQWPQDSKNQESIQDVDCSSFMKNFGTPCLCKRKRAPTPKSCPCVLESLAFWLQSLAFFLKEILWLVILSFHAFVK